MAAIKNYGGKLNNLEHIFSKCRPGPNACVEWAGRIAKNGYGLTSYKHKGIGVHRLVWRLINGDPGSLFVLHRCDNRKCCNVDHLFLGTQTDNMRDKIRKGRQPAQYKAKATCGKGHPKIPENTYSYKYGNQCKICSAEYQIKNYKEIVERRKKNGQWYRLKKKTVVISRDANGRFT